MRFSFSILVLVSFLCACDSGVQTPSTSVLITKSATPSAKTAQLNGSANPAGHSAVAWFRYSKDNPGACSDTFGARAPATGGLQLGAGSVETPFTVEVSNLSVGTTYYFCAIVSSSAGNSLGTVLSFTTLGNPCAADAECNSGHCTEGVCCDSACGGDLDCRSCLASRNGDYDAMTRQYVPGTDGVCADVAANAYACPMTECSTHGVCGGKGFPACAWTGNKPAGTPCAGTKMCNGMGLCL